MAAFSSGLRGLEPHRRADQLSVEENENIVKIELKVVEIEDLPCESDCE